MTRKPAEQDRGVQQLPVPIGATPEERAANFQKMLTEFIAQTDAEDAAAQGKPEDGA